MHSGTKEPEKRPLDSLAIPGQREAVEKFMAGSTQETFTYNGATIIIEEDRDMMGEGRYLVVSALDGNGERILYACVHDAKTHIAQQVTQTIQTDSGKGYGSTVRDVIEAIVGIPSFEIAHFSYLIIFLIKRGYIPTKKIEGKGYMSQNMVYGINLELDTVLGSEDLERIFDSLRDLYEGFQKIKTWENGEGKENALLRLKGRRLPFYIRLQHHPELAKKCYNLLKEENLVSFWEKRDELIPEIVKFSHMKK